mgnify:CR=1 FL=1
MAEEKPAQADLITTANLLTFSRLILLPLVIAGIATNRGYLAAAAMAVLWVTDLLDGRIARLMRQAGAFGKALDSTVDFVLIYSLFIAFYAAGRLATYQFAVLYLSMLTILFLRFLLTGAGRGDELPTTTLGKLTGSLQYLYLLFLVALEVLPKSRIASALNIALFALLASAIILNSLECILRMRTLARGAETS